METWDSGLHIENADYCQFKSLHVKVGEKHPAADGVTRAPSLLMSKLTRSNTLGQRYNMSLALVQGIPTELGI